MPTDRFAFRRSETAGTRRPRFRPGPLVAVLVIAALMAAIPATALGSSLNNPTASQYHSSSNAASDAAHSGGSDGSDALAGLPFTGLDAAIMVAAAAGLIGTGIVLRRLSRRGSTDLDGRRA